MVNLRSSVALGGVLFTVAATTALHAQTAAPWEMDRGSVLVTLLICGFLGLVGQGARVIVGMKTLYDAASSTRATAADSFNLARLTFSLIIGFVAGFVSALAIWATDPKGLNAIDLSSFTTALKFAVAGYIGTDVIEAFTTKYFETATAVKAGNAAATAATDPAVAAG